MKHWRPHLQSRALMVALALSLAVHAAILAIKFAPELKKRLKDNLPALEVILVNAKSQSTPTKADALAQANLDRGGNTDANRRLKSPLPVSKNRPKDTLAAERQAASASATPEHTAQQQRVLELEKQAQALMTELQAKQPVNAPAAEERQPPANPKTINVADLAARSLEAARLEAEISKEWDNYQKRPKRKFLGARVQEYRFASYVESWRQKVERVGNLNYPEQAKTQQIYGTLRLTVSIRADGSLESVELNKSSGFTVLDEAAKHIVEMAAPYAEFPADIRKDTDILSITRTWTFTHEDTLTAQ